MYFHQVIWSFHVSLTEREMIGFDASDTLFLRFIVEHSVVSVSG